MTYACALVEKQRAALQDMTDYWLWWILAAVLIGAELVTGTFYLLAVATAFAFGGAAAFAGTSTPLQLLTAGILAVVGTVIAHRWRRRQGEAPALPGLDIGQSVRVDAWHPDGTARVEYRGTQWDGVLASDETPRRHTMYIVATRGSTLVLSAERPDTGR
jgi:membrane protein implicated in regulation of membrane protease activity